MKIRLSIVLALAICLSACKTKPTIQAEHFNIPSGKYLGTLNIQGNSLPFEFVIDSTRNFILKNGNEEFAIKNVVFDGDSMVVPMHIFDTKLSATWVKGEQTFKGYWKKNYVKDYEISFTAKPYVEHENKDIGDNISTKIAPKYKVFFESMLQDSTVSVGEFKQQGHDLNGTFLTTTGDYRYLRGGVLNNEIKLYTFDGEHAFVFTGKVDSKQMIKGHFYSGKTWHETWNAYPDSSVRLEDPSTLTHLNEGFESLEFTGIDLNKDTVTLKDERFKNKAVIVQIMGSWCPNCMDETAFLSQWYQNQKTEKLEMVSLAFEKKDNFIYAKSRLQALKERYNVEYPLLFAGSSDKTKAAKALPALSSVIAYPTLIFMDKEHKVTHIHTGFNGPGTGHHYEQWKLEFKQLVNDLIK
ncbi:MAG: TlpA disulfide reductase family protein [Bacteroidia bacterium]